MRTAYSGRAAAYFAKGDYEKALGDQNTVVLMYAVEVEVLDQVRDPDRGDVLVEAAAAYRSRSDMLPPRQPAHELGWSDGLNLLAQDA